MAEFYFSREIDPKYEGNISFYAQDAEYQEVLVKVFPQVNFVCDKYIDSPSVS
jgi:hypothetical protein